MDDDVTIGLERDSDLRAGILLSEKSRRLKRCFL